MNPKIKPVVLFCISAALWAIPSYYLRGMPFGRIFFLTFGFFPAFFLQLCLFVPPVEKWVRYVPIPGILGFGVLEIILLKAWNCLAAATALTALLFIAAPFIGFAAGWAYYKFKPRSIKNKGNRK